jgi:hypothetical protein
VKAVRRTRQNNLDGGEEQHHFAARDILRIHVDEPTMTAPAMRHRGPARFTVAFGAIASAALLASCANPRTEANVAQALNDAATEISGLKNDIADLQTQLDSLRTLVLKQDTTISRLAEVNHIPIAR